MFAVDLPGFGGSERREDLLSPRAMGEFLARLVAEAALPSPHIVAPDVGTSAALFAAAAHPDLFSTVTVGTGGAAVPIQLGEPLASWVLDPTSRSTARWTRARSWARPSTRSRVACPRRVAPTTWTATPGPFAESMRYVRSYPEELSVLAELLPQISTLVTIIEGVRDRVVPLANAQFLDERLPTSHLVVIDAGHFVWEEAPAEYAAALGAS